MNKKGQEPIPVLMALVAAAAAFWMSARMGSGLMMNVITFLLTGVVSYFLVARIADN